MPTFAKVKKIAQNMIDADVNRDRLFAKCDEMFKSQWSLPYPLSGIDYIHKVVSTDPHDVIRAGTRVLATLDPGVKLQPLTEDDQGKAQANRIERALKWHLYNASRRRRASIIRDVVMSSLRYDEICARVMFLPHQKKQGSLSAARARIAERFGPYAVIMYNPRHVHTRYSDLMPEAVLYNSVVPIDEVIDSWGDLAKEVKAKRDEDDARYVTVYDYTDLEERAVWCVATSDPVAAPPDAKDVIQLIESQPHEMSFMPWVCRIGGTTLESDPEHQRIPLLYSVKQSGQWDTLNSLLTLLFSEGIAYASAPRLHIQGPGAEDAEVDYGDVNKPLRTGPNTNVAPLQPPALDQGIASLSEQIRAALSKSTVASILQGGEIPAQTAYATLNLATLTALGTLKPYKELAELAVGDILTQMLLWVEFSGETVKAYDTDSRGFGKMYDISPDDIDPKNLYISVELKPDMPTDRQQRINAAAIAVDKLNYPVEEALQDIGLTDPQSAIRTRMIERLQEYFLQKYIKQDDLQMQMAVQQQAQQQAQAAQQQQAQQQAQQQQPMPGAPPGVEGVGGQGFNPAMGGAPPAEMFPQATREGQTGLTMEGEQTAEVA